MNLPKNLMQASLALLVTQASLIGCTYLENNRTDQPTHSNTPAQKQDVHNSRDAVDWDGIYFGVIPCASCPGINTLITLNKNGTFEKTTLYQENEERVETETGNITWSENGSSVMLGESHYKVGEGRLFQLDALGNEITDELADYYTLKKIDPEADAGFGYSSRNYTDKAGAKYEIVFNANTELPTAVVRNNKLDKIVFQTGSDRKGTRYTGDGISFLLAGENVTLTIGNKKTELKQTVKK